MMRKIFCILLVVFLLVGCTKVEAAKSDAEETVAPVTEAISETEEVQETEAVEETVPETEPEPTEPPIVEKYPTVPMFFQTDYPYTNYGGYGSVATHGCGIASLAMVASYLNDREILPDELALKYGHYNTSGGSSWMLFPETAEELGIVMENQTWKWSELEEALREGKVIIANAHESSPFTSGGHFVVLTGITEDGKVFVNDPYKGNYGQWSSNVLKDGFENGFEKKYFNDCYPMWIYNKKDESVITNTKVETPINYEIIHSENEGDIPYYVYTPSVVNTEEETPLVIWLHDSWEKGLSELAFTNISLPKMLKEWTMDEFNAYIVAPQLEGELKTWNNDVAMAQVQRIVDEFMATHKVDKTKVILMGQGFGAQGTVYMTQKMPDVFTKAVSFSLYDPKVDITNTNIDIKFYIGSAEHGEDNGCVRVTDNIASQFGENLITTIETSHAQLPFKVIMEDSNNNNQSDFFEDLLA